MRAAYSASSSASVSTFAPSRPIRQHRRIALPRVPGPGRHRRGPDRHVRRRTRPMSRRPDRDRPRWRPEDAELAELEEVDTPGKRTIEEVSEFLDVAKPHDLVKTLIYRGRMSTRSRCACAAITPSMRSSCARGWSDTRLEFVEVEMADDATTGKTIQGPGRVRRPGRAGRGYPRGGGSVGAPDGQLRSPARTRKGHHFVNVNHGRDFEPAGLRRSAPAQPGDICARSRRAL